MTNLISEDTRASVKTYYGQTLASSTDLKTSACCSTEALSDSHKNILKLIDDEILTRFYGCGSPIPPALEGQTVLDLGCGTGRDSYLASKLVGPAGRVIGVDMTREQLDVAVRHRDRQMQMFGYTRPNVEFKLGYIEEIDGLGIPESSVDVVISNCVLNLTVDKQRAFQNIFRLLKPGGELYFSDIFADRRIPEDLRRDEILYGECLSGALYVEDFRRIMLECGCPDYRIVSSRPVTLDDPRLRERAGHIGFHSLTVRAFRLDDLEDKCEDYGQVATYRGTLPEHPHRFALDDHHLFLSGKPLLVCGNTASMLSRTRFAPHFEVRGDRSVHYGLFDDCAAPATATQEGGTAACC